MRQFNTHGKPSKNGSTSLHYTADEPHGLPHDPFKAIIAPRPIGWIGTLDREGRPNLAPYSFFNAVSSRPHLIGFSSEGFKHSAANVRETGEFTFSLATLPLAQQMNTSSASLEPGTNEFEVAQLTMAKSRVVRAPFVGESPAAMECKLVHFLELEDLGGRKTGGYFVIGQVVATYINPEFIVEGRFDATKAQTIARCGYSDYATLESQWQMGRPNLPSMNNTHR